MLKLDLPTRLDENLWGWPNCRNTWENNHASCRGSWIELGGWRKRYWVNILVHLLMGPKNNTQLIIIKRVPGAVGLGGLRWDLRNFILETFLQEIKISSQAWEVLISQTSRGLTPDQFWNQELRQRFLRLKKIRWASNIPPGPIKTRLLWWW